MSLPTTMHSNFIGLMHTDFAIAVFKAPVCKVNNVNMGTKFNEVQNKCEVVPHICTICTSLFVI